MLQKLRSQGVWVPVDTLYSLHEQERKTLLFSRTFAVFLFSSCFRDFEFLFLSSRTVFFFFLCLSCSSLLSFHAVFYVYVDLVSLVSSSQFVSPFLPVYLCLSFPLMSVDAWVTERRSMSCRSLLSSSLSSFAWRRFWFWGVSSFLLFFLPSCFASHSLCGS